MKLGIAVLAAVLVSGCAGDGPPVLSPFGATAGRLTPHQGVEWAGRVGQPVHAAVDGEVLIGGSSATGAYGITVQLWQPEARLMVMYAHLDSAEVEFEELVGGPAHRHHRNHGRLQPDQRQREATPALRGAQARRARQPDAPDTLRGAAPPDAAH